MSDLTSKPPVDAEYVPPAALEAISRAEIDIAIATARKYPCHAPHQLAKVKQDMIAYATLDQETAESCFYTLPRGGKTIQGPSVRLAEIALACYGNMRVVTRILDTISDEDHPHVVTQAVAIDLEKNITVGRENRRRITKKKSAMKPDDDDINLATNAASAIAFRDSVYKIIPGALIKPVYEAAKKVAIGDARTLTDRRVRCVETFSKMGITKERVLARLEHTTIEEVTLEDIETLLGLHNAIKDGEIGLEDAFPSKPVDTKPLPTGLQQAKGEVSKTETKKEEKAADKAPAEGPSKAAEPSKADPATSTPPAEQTTQAPQPAAEPAQPEQTPEPDQAFAAKQGDSDGLASVKLVASKAGITLNQLMTYLQKKKLAREGQKLSELAEGKLANIANHMNTWLPDIRALPR